MLKEFQTYARSIAFIESGTYSCPKTQEDIGNKSTTVKGEVSDGKMCNQIANVIESCFIHYSSLYLSPSKRKKIGLYGDKMGKNAG